MPVKRISPNCNELGRKYCGEVDFFDETGIPLFEVNDVFSFTKLIGHAKYLNASIGKVLYRGQYKINFNQFDGNDQLPCMNCAKNTISEEKEKNRDQGQFPSAYRHNKPQNDIDHNIDTQIARIMNDGGNPRKPNVNLESFSKCNENHGKNANYVWEALLQHYGAETRYLDVVDNHWVALWFACHKYEKETKCYIRNPNMYSYIIVFALPTEKQSGIPPYHDAKGVFVNDECIVVDLRQAFPSQALRPHMQHGMLFALKDENENYREDYACNIVCIIKVRTDLCIDWIGNTDLLREESLFPCKCKDEMRNLIENKRKDLFDDVMKHLKTSES